MAHLARQKIRPGQPDLAHSLARLSLYAAMGIGGSADTTEERAETMPKMSHREAFNQAMSEELQRDYSVLVMGANLPQR